MTLDQRRIDELIAFAAEHESAPDRDGDLVVAKSELLARVHLGHGPMPRLSAR